MFQDIQPYSLDTQYTPTAPREADLVILLDQRHLLLSTADKDKQLPTLGDVHQHYPDQQTTPTYLLSIEGQRFFFIDAKLSLGKGFAYQSVNALRQLQPQWLAFATITAVHLAVWYAENRFCGKCGHELTRGTKERSLVCPNCGLEIYPRIAPAIIVAVRHHDQLLLTKYTSGYGHYALIAGFVEIGETLEDTIRREVFEETGLEVENIRYYKSQPWGFSQSLLVGFFADLAADDTYETSAYHSDEAELSEIKWFDRDAIPLDDSTLSLTWEMITKFRNHEID